jgi:hypothetical protein
MGAHELSVCLGAIEGLKEYHNGCGNDFGFAFDYDCQRFLQEHDRVPGKVLGLKLEKEARSFLLWQKTLEVTLELQAHFKSAQLQAASDRASTLKIRLIFGKLS